MAINCATNLVRLQRGVSLIELLIASSLGLIILASVGSVFLSGHNMAAERTKQLMLAQDVNDAIRIMKNDIQRAGYNSDNSGSLTLSGASSTIVVNPAKDSISYVYEDENAKWRIVKFRFKSASPNNVIQICVDMVTPSVGGVTQSDASCGTGTFFSLMDQAYINVTDFDVVSTPLSTSSATSSIIKISLSATLKNTSYTKTVSTEIKTRNWN